MKVWVLLCLVTWCALVRAGGDVPKDLVFWQKLANTIPRKSILVEKHDEAVYFFNAFTGERGHATGCDLLDLTRMADGDELARCKEVLIGRYKLHIMPKPEEVPAVVKAILRRAAHNPEFSSLIYQMKVFVGPLRTEDGSLVPIIVLYPACGQKTATQLAQHLVRLLVHFSPVSVKDIPDENARFVHDPHMLCPRYNIPFVPSLRRGPLVCYAQGEGSDKGDRVFVIKKDSAGSFPRRWYAEPLIMRGLHVLTVKEVAGTLGYVDGIDLTEEQKSRLYEQLADTRAYPMAEKPVGDAFVFYHVASVSNLETLAELINSGRAKLMAGELVKTLLENLLEKEVYGPVRLGALFYDAADNYALYPSTFLADDVEHDYHLSAT